MAGKVTAAPVVALDARDLARVHVAIGQGGAPLGDAAAALDDRRLTEAERAAVRAVVRAVELLRTRAALAGIDDAGRAVRLVLRDREAGSSGPWATLGSISVGSRNALATRSGGRGRDDVLITVDAALHELTHVVQFSRIPAGVRPHAAILEGVADTVAMLATGDDTLGEGFFRTGRDGRPQGAIRELGSTRRASSPPLGPTMRTHAEAARPGAEVHAAGGVVSSAFSVVRTRLGRARAEQLVWAVIRDPQAWVDGGSWGGLARAMRRCADQLWPADPGARAAIDAALAATGLHALVPARFALAPLAAAA